MNACTIRTVWTGKITAYCPTRDDVLGLRVGDVAPNCFGEARVTEIHARGNDVHGKAFVCHYTEFGPNGSTISDSMKEGEIVRTLLTTQAHKSAELDAIERKLNSHG